MKIAEEVIGLIKELAPDEWRKVADYIASARDEGKESAYYLKRIIPKKI